MSRRARTTTRSTAPASRATALPTGGPERRGWRRGEEGRRQRRRKVHTVEVGAVMYPPRVRGYGRGPWPTRLPRGPDTSGWERGTPVPHRASCYGCTHGRFRGGLPGWRSSAAVVAATGGDAECGRALPGADLFGETMLLARDRVENSVVVWSRLAKEFRGLRSRVERMRSRRCKTVKAHYALRSQGRNGQATRRTVGGWRDHATRRGFPAGSGTTIASELSGHAGE